MPIKINKNDIKNMVFESVKTCLFENVDIETMIDALPNHIVLEAYGAVFGGDALQALSSARDMVGAIKATFDNASPEQQSEFIRRIKGEFRPNNASASEEPIEIDDSNFEFSPEVQKVLKETVNRVVGRKLNEMSYQPDVDFTLEQIRNFDKSYNDWYNKLYELKNEVWKKNDGRNTPQLDHCFWAMKIMDSAKQILNGYYMLLQQNNNNIS